MMYDKHRATFERAQTACRERHCWSPFPDMPGKYPDAETAQAKGLAASMAFSPAGGGPGTSVVILGSNFSGTTAVRFNGTAATFTVNNAGQISATVPAGATSGPVTVVKGADTATSARGSTGVRRAAPPPTDRDARRARAARREFSARRR